VAYSCGVRAERVLSAKYWITVSRHLAAGGWLGCLLGQSSERQALLYCAHAVGTQRAMLRTDRTAAEQRIVEY